MASSLLERTLYRLAVVCCRWQSTPFRTWSFAASPSIVNSTLYATISRALPAGRRESRTQDFSHVNFQIDTTKVGGRCIFVGAVGDDAFGEVVLRRLVDHGVTPQLIRVVRGVLTGAAFVSRLRLQHRPLGRRARKRC